MVLLFFAVSLVANLLVPTQVTPIYNWSLYSYPLRAKSSHSFLVITYNGGKIISIEHTWQEPQKLLLTNPLNLYTATVFNKKEDFSKQHFFNVWLPAHSNFQRLFPQFTNFPSEREIKRFPQWFKRYLAQYVQEPVNEIVIYRKTVAFSRNGHVQELASELIFTIV